MIGRREFGLAGVSAAAMAALPGLVRAQERDAHAGHGGMHIKCAEACNDCQRECDACSNHCAKMLADGQKAHLETLHTCQDCADLCATAAQIAARQGPFSALTCQACADACARCAKACAKFADDKMMAACAEECRKCEAACREMIGHHTAAKG